MGSEIVLNFTFHNALPIGVHPGFVVGIFSTTFATDKNTPIAGSCGHRNSHLPLGLLRKLMLGGAIGKGKEEVTSCDSDLICTTRLFLSVRQQCCSQGMKQSFDA